MSFLIPCAAPLSPAFPDQKAISPSLGIGWSVSAPSLRSRPVASRRRSQHIRYATRAFNGRLVARGGARLPAPVLIARVLRLAVTQLENWAHALVASPFNSGTM